MAVAIGLDETLAKRALRPSPLPSSCLLSPASQAVLLRAALTDGGERRINLVTTRGEALEQIEQALEQQQEQRELSLSAGGGGGGGGGVNPGRGSTAALILNPYYRSPWGKKKVLGRSVEEGEGFGPRKELFELAARQLGERWRSPPPQPSPSTSPPPITATAREGTAEVELVVCPPPDAPDGGAFLLRMKDGWKVRVGGQTRVLEGVRMIQDGGGGGGSGADGSDGSTRWVFCGWIGEGAGWVLTWVLSENTPWQPQRCCLSFLEST